MDSGSIYHVLDELSEIICFFDDKGNVSYMNRAGYRELDFDSLDFKLEAMCIGRIIPVSL